MTSKLIADIRADLERFRSGADPTLDVENILDLCAENERLRDALVDANAAGDLLIKRLDRVEHALILFSKHVGGIGWNQPLDSLLVDIGQTWQR